MPFVLLAFAVAGFVAVALARPLGRRAFWLVLPVFAATFVWGLVQLPDVVAGEVRTASFTWVPQLGLAFDFRLDGFALVMVLIVSGIGALVTWYSPHYFPAGSSYPGSVAGLLTLFGGAMLGLVLSDHLLALVVFWELTSVTSYLLIGGKDRDPLARSAALQAVIVTGTGGIAMLAGFVLLGQAAGTYGMSELLADPPTGGAVPVALVLVLIGAFTKSAQFPFSSWLPGAMVAPTPVSAYLHSATMVKAGVYLVARFGPAFATTAPWRPLIIGAGLTSMVVGGLRALRQNDLKLLLAFGTVSQLGFMILLFGLGLPKATTAGVVVIIAHALFKAALFLVVGIVDHQAHTRDLRALALATRSWAPVAVVTVLSAASMAGLPPLLGFVGKEKAYAALDAGGVWGSTAILIVVVLASMVTFAYSARIVWGAFRTSERAGVDVPAVVATPAPPSPAFLAPAAVLAALSLVFGLVPSLLDDLVGAAAGALDATIDGVELVLWEGFTTPLVLSLATIAGGVALFAARRRVARLLARGAHLPSTDDAFLSTLRIINTTADRVTGVVQSGSFPVYMGVLLLTVATVPGVVLAVDGSWPGWPVLLDRPAHLLVIAIIVAGALATSMTRRRFTAALLLGSVGYGMALLFALQGAPDLALTQVAVETLSVLLFMLVLRVLPDEFPRARSRRRQGLRIAVATCVALFVFFVTLVATGSRTVPSIADGYVELALPEGEGRNVVNVELVDFRGLDTLGEITVLAAAAIGAVALARVAFRGRDSDGSP